MIRTKITTTRSITLMRCASLLVWVLAGAALLPAATAQAKDLPTVQVKKTVGCGCCNLWVRHMREAGFKVDAENTAPGLLARFKAQNGIDARHASCHTARVGGYTIEGHVPAKDVARLLSEKPDAVGLSVPGMPIGSPGMEVGDERDAYQVLLIKRDGTTGTFSSYEQKSADSN